MYYHYAYQLNIQSEVLLSKLTSVQKTSDVTLSVGNIVQRPNQLSDKSFLGKLDGIGRCLVTGGNSIRIEPYEDVCHDMIAPNVLGGCMAVILRQRGYLVLHASSVAMGSGAIAFLGGSGWGKSTLAAALHADHRSVLTDDIMALQLGNNTPVVIPAFPQCRLSSAAAEFLGKDSATPTSLSSHIHKRAYTFEHGFQTQPLPLKKMYILAKGDAHSITLISPKEAFAHLVSHTRAIATLSNKNALKKHFQQCTSLLEQVPCYRFVRKPGLEELPNLVKLVTNHANGSPLKQPQPNQICSLAER